MQPPLQDHEIPIEKQSSGSPDKLAIELHNIVSDHNALERDAEDMDVRTDDTEALINGPKTVPRGLETGRSSKKEPFLQRVKKAWNPLRNLRDAVVPPQSEQQLGFLDGIRGFAMCWVMAVHSWIFLGWAHSPGPHYGGMEKEWYMRLIQNGELSVDMFFVLSGFLIAHILIREYERAGSISIPRFYLRRFFRIYPAYMLVFVIYWPVLNIVGQFFDCPHCSGCNTYGWMNFIFINNFGPAYGSCMAWTWSICVEVQFYIISPFVVYVFLKRRKLGFALFIVLIIANSIIRASIIAAYGLNVPSLDVGVYIDLIYTKPYARAGPYVMGLVTAAVWAIWREKQKAYTPTRTQSVLWFCGVIVSLVTFAVIVMFGKGFEKTRVSAFIFLHIHRDVWGICSGFLIFASLVASRMDGLYSGVKPLFLYPVNALRWFWSWRVWYTAAQMSYSAYLLHPIWITIFYVVLLPQIDITFWWFLLFTIANIIVSNIFALVPYLLVERPFMNLR